VVPFEEAKNASDASPKDHTRGAGEMTTSEILL